MSVKMVKMRRPFWNATGFRTGIAVFFFSIILCGQPLHAGPIVDNKNGAVSDKGTGLMWQMGDSFLELGKGVNWYEALEYVEGKNAANFAGHNDWRIPTLDELNALWDSALPTRNKDDEAIGLPKGFEAGGSYWLWTSNERGLDNAWYFGLGQKENYFNLKDLSDLDQGVKMVRTQ
ncbi:uncharacterized protein METZ01_LOCUS260027 [marine metagenome]|uniref:Lcl C-terminal domain-containing protein n=1 Tax=marine metagenome TaxID=408172 RepID=A0A382J7X3_9ZZZZ